MNKMIEYLEKLIEEYKQAKGTKEKESCAQNIQIFYDSVLSNKYYSRKFLKEFKNKYNEISDRKLFQRGIAKIHPDFDISKKTNYIHQANKDLEFINYLMDNIKLDRTVYIEKERKSTNIDDLNNYINSNEKFKEFLKEVNYDEIVDENIKDNELLKFSDKYLLLLNSDNILTRIDGLMDMYNGYSFDRFFRVPCDLAELALSRRLSLSTTIDRYNNIKDLKMIRYGIKSAYEYDTYCYGVASLLSRAIVEKYGTDFDRIVDITDTLINNKNSSLESIVEKIELKDSDIIDSVKKYEKLIKH